MGSSPVVGRRGLAITGQFLISSGDPLSRHFEIGLGSARWTPVAAGDSDLHSTSRSYESDDGDWLLELSLEPAAQTNRWLLTIALESRSGTARTDESLAVQLGPGLGEEPMEGMGIVATTLYSYVDPVVRVWWVGFSHQTSIPKNL